MGVGRSIRDGKPGEIHGKRNIRETQAVVRSLKQLRKAAISECQLDS